MQIFAKYPVKINGKKFVIVATETVYLPQFRTPHNSYSMFICGAHALNSLYKGIYATSEEAIKAAENLASRINGAVLPIETFFL